MSSQSHSYPSQTVTEYKTSHHHSMPFQLLYNAAACLAIIPSPKIFLTTSTPQIPPFTSRIFENLASIIHHCSPGTTALTVRTFKGLFFLNSSQIDLSIFKLSTGTFGTSLRL